VAHNGFAIIWDPTTRKGLDTLSVSASKGGALMKVRYSPDGNWIVSSGSDMTMRLWEASTGDSVRSFPIRQKEPLSLRFSPDSKHVLSAGDSVADEWDVSTGSLVREIRYGALVYEANYSPSGTMIVTAGSDSVARIWDARTGVLLGSLLGHTDIVTSASFSHDGTKVVTASRDSTIRIWTLNLTPSSVSEGVAQTGPAMLRSYPNPARDHVQLRFTVDKAGEVGLVMVDVLGREVFRSPQEDLPAGEYVRDLDVRGLASGRYWGIVRMGDRREFSPIDIQR
jgi:WD40 repeat protein